MLQLLEQVWTVGEGQQPKGAGGETIPDAVAVSSLGARIRAGIELAC